MSNKPIVSKTQQQNFPIDLQSTTAGLNY